MKKLHLLLTGAVLLGATVWLGHANANALGNTWSRGFFDPDKGTGCLAVSNGGLSVQFESHINSFGANVNVAPNTLAGCTLRRTNYTAQLVTSCFDGTHFGPTTVHGSSTNEQDILHDCSSHLGASQAIWYVSAP